MFYRIFLYKIPLRAFFLRTICSSLTLAKEIYLKAGDAVMFTDAITHGSAKRVNLGYRRAIVYRYSPRFVRERFNLPHSDQLLSRLTAAQLDIIQPMKPQRPPQSV